MKLRPYQHEAIDRTLDALTKHQSTLVVMPTGTGKTILFAHLIDLSLPYGRCMVLAHREELISQAAEKIHAVTGIVPAIEMAEQRAELTMGVRPDIVVSSIQTQVAGRGERKRMHLFDPNDFSLVIVDEAHRSVADTYRRTLDHYRTNKNCKVVGVTATPDRGDEEALGQIFESCAYEYSISDAINDGWLVPIEQGIVYVEGLDFSKCRTTAGDLNGGDLAAQMEAEKPLHKIVASAVKASRGKCLMFAASVKHSELLTELLCRPDYAGENSANHIDGKTDRATRRKIVDDYRKGKFQYLNNCAVCTEGFDVPDIRTIVPKPTKVRSLYAQMLGRGMRPLPGIDRYETAEERKKFIAESAKPSMLVLDYVGQSGRHKLVNAVDVLGGKFSDEVTDRAKHIIAKFGELNVATALQQADIQIRDEKARRAQLAEQQRLEDAARREARKHIVATADFHIDYGDPFTQLGIRPARIYAPGGREPATQKQIGWLKWQGIPVPQGLTKVHAGQLISRRKQLEAQSVARIPEIAKQAFVPHKEDARSELLKRYPVPVASRKP